MVEDTAVKEEKVTVPKEFEKLTAELDKMSALEISKFVKFLEEYWGVSAAAPAVAVAAPGAGLMGDGCIDQGVLGIEVAIEPPVGQARRTHDLRHSDILKAPLAE